MKPENETTPPADEGRLEASVRQQRDDVVPGVMRCARCEFRVTRVSLNVNVGTVTAGDNRTELCPNGCGPLWPVSWEQEAREGWKISEHFAERAIAAEAALRELVALKDMKDRLHNLHEMGHGTDYGDYHRRQPLAWAQARAVLLPNAKLNGAEPSGGASV